MINKIVNADDVVEAAEVNCESKEFIRKLMDYLLDAPSIEDYSIESE